MRTSQGCALVRATLVAATLRGWMGAAGADQAPAGAPAPPAAEVAAEAPRGPRAPLARGFAFAVRLDRVRELRLEAAGGLTAGDYDTVPGFFVGYKLGRLLVGAEFALSSQGSTTTSTGMPERTTRDTTLELGPGIQLTLLSSAPVELYGGLDLTAGHVFSDREGTTTPSASADRLGFRLGLGVRAWLTPHLACAGLAGFAGQSIYVDGSTSTGGAEVRTSTSSGMFGEFARVELLSLF